MVQVSTHTHTCTAYKGAGLDPNRPRRYGCTCAFWPTVTVKVHLVVMDSGGIFGAFLDAERASEAARNIEGVVAVLPVAEDYRAATS